MKKAYFFHDDYSFYLCCMLAILQLSAFKCHFSLSSFIRSFFFHFEQPSFSLLKVIRGILLLSTDPTVVLSILSPFIIIILYKPL